jgi:hypothetical protein
LSSQVAIKGSEYLPNPRVIKCISLYVHWQSYVRSMEVSSLPSPSFL